MVFFFSAECLVLFNCDFDWVPNIQHSDSKQRIKWILNMFSIKKQGHEYDVEEIGVICKR